MEKRRLGRTGLEISLMSMGGIPFQRSDAKNTVAIMRRALELGVNFIDTARGYTVSENYIGQGLKELGRENFIIATKSNKRTRKEILAELETSLQELQTDYIDLYQFHNVSNFADYETLMGEEGGYQAIVEKRDAGVIRHIGITSHSADMLKRFIEDDHFETIQFPYNSVERQAEEHFKLAKSKDMGVLVMKPLAGGAIMNKPLALREIMENPAITALIPGVDSVEQLEENVALASPLVPLSAEERAIIRQEAEELGTRFCRRCRYCLPCAVGIDIPMMFILEGYYSRYNLQDWAKERYDAIEIKASDCIECGLCESRCPYHLPIRDMLKQTAESFR